MADTFEAIRREIILHPANSGFRALKYEPLYTAGTRARVVVVGQAPGRRAQLSGTPWDDASGARLLYWMGMDRATFYDPQQVAILPMDFYYPGKGKGGDLPPRKDFAPLWHRRLLALMPEAALFLLVGRYAQTYYLDYASRQSLTQTVRAFKEAPAPYFPIVHPSPLNFRWHLNNPWFEEEVVPALRQRVRQALRG